MISSVIAEPGLLLSGKALDSPGLFKWCALFCVDGKQFSPISIMLDVEECVGWVSRHEQEMESRYDTLVDIETFSSEFSENPQIWSSISADGKTKKNVNRFFKIGWPKYFICCIENIGNIGKTAFLTNSLKLPNRVFSYYSFFINAKNDGVLSFKVYQNIFSFVINDPL